MTHTRTSLYEVVIDGAGHTVADRLRLALAEEALADDEWRELYDRVMDGIFGFPENLPGLPLHHGEIPPGAALAPRHILGAPWEDLHACTRLLTSRAEELGMRLSLDVPQVHQVAAIVGAQVWCLATGVSDLTRAASLGHDAVSSLAAVLARASGGGVLFPELPQGQADTRFRTERLDAALEHCKAWAQYHLTPAEAATALQLAACDLSYRALGASFTSEAARHLAQFALRVSA